MNNGAGAGTPLQRCASDSGACSCRNSPARRCCTIRTLSTTLEASISIRSGNVLMNTPSARSAPVPPCMRPNSTVPNTTVSHPVARATTCAQARWNRLAALTPRARAWLRSNADSGSGNSSRTSSTSDPSPCTLITPNGAQGSSTLLSIARKYASCSSRLTPNSACATKLRNGSGAGKLSASPPKWQRTSSSTISSVV